MPWKRSIPASTSGFSLTEMLIVSLMAVVMLGFSLSLVVQQRRQFQIDRSKGEVNQTLRSAMDLLGTDIRQGGELLGTDTTVPSFILQNGGGANSPDTFAIQRKLLPEVLQVCQPIVAGTSAAMVSIDGGVVNPSCSFTDLNANPLPDDLESWQAYRLAQPNQRSIAFIRDAGAGNGTSASLGEFFIYTNEATTTNGTDTFYSIQRNGSWANTYNPLTSFIYILEEREYSLTADADAPGTSILQLLLNRGVDAANPGVTAAAIPLANALTNFQVVVNFPSSTVNSLNPNRVYQANASNPDWRTLTSVEVTLTAAKPKINPNLSPAERARFFADYTLNSRYLPRNVMSVR